MTTLEIGSTAPDFTLSADGGRQIALSQFRGSKVILYFYPKDDTPGCTKESCSFRDNLPDLKKLNVQVVGISKDSPASHDKFRDKYDLNFPLVSDEKGEVCEAYGVWGERSMYGKKFMGIIRSTFLIDENGKIAEIWRNVKVDGHTEDILKTLKSLSKAA